MQTMINIHLHENFHGEIDHYSIGFAGDPSIIQQKNFAIALHDGNYNLFMAATDDFVRLDEDEQQHVTNETLRTLQNFSNQLGQHRSKRTSVQTLPMLTARNDDTDKIRSAIRLLKTVQDETSSDELRSAIELLESTDMMQSVEFFTSNT